MAGLKDRLRADLTAAMKARDEVRTRRRVLVRTPSRAFIAAVRSARSRSFSPAMWISCRLRRARGAPRSGDTPLRPRLEAAAGRPAPPRRSGLARRGDHASPADGRDGSTRET